MKTITSEAAENPIEKTEKTQEVVETMQTMQSDMLKGQRAAQKVLEFSTSLDLTTKQQQVQEALTTAMEEVEGDLGDVAFFIRFKKMKGAMKLNINDVVELQHKCCASLNALIEESKTLKALLPSIKAE